MKHVSVSVCIILLAAWLTGCAGSRMLSGGSLNEGVKTFSPSQEAASEESESASPEKRGIIKSLASPDGKKMAYIYTKDAAAKTVVYALAVLDKDKPLDYEDPGVYSSVLLFDIEWGDDATLMVSLNEKETNEVSPVKADDVTVMFGRASSKGQQ